MNPRDLRDRVAGWAEAARVSEQLAGAEPALSPSESFARAEALWALAPHLFREPRSAVEAEAIEQVRTTWGRLRARLGA